MRRVGLIKNDYRFGGCRVGCQTFEAVCADVVNAENLAADGVRLSYFADVFVLLIAVCQ